VVQPGVAKLIVSDIPPLLGEKELPYFVESREKRFGMPLAKVTEGREEKLPAFRATLQPMRQALKGRAFLGGDTPDYADCIIFGSFMWSRCVSPLRLLAEDDVLHGWHERMLDLNDGAARKAPCRAA
jgi:glutathione S-transferase